MKIKTSNEHIQNSIVNFPIVGKKQVTDGEIDVPEEVASLLLQNEDWTEVNVSSKEDSGTSKKEVEGAKKQITKTPEKTPIQDALTELPIEELIDIAKKAKIKGWQILKTKPEGLRNLIRKNLKDS